MKALNLLYRFPNPILEDLDKTKFHEFVSKYGIVYKEVIIFQWRKNIRKEKKRDKSYIEERDIRYMRKHKRYCTDQGESNPGY